LFVLTRRNLAPQLNDFAYASLRNFKIAMLA
jgi:hypothetical protein